MDRRRLRSGWVSDCPSSQGDQEDPSFDGLARMAQDIVRQDPLSGHLFVFLNRRRDRVKILYWDRDGYAVWAKRLEAGTFRLPEATGPQLEVRHAELAMLLGGIDPSGSRRRVRFALPEATPVSTRP